jgi:7-carboxy-7-deazaguanine synthase
VYNETWTRTSGIPRNKLSLICQRYKWSLYENILSPEEKTMNVTEIFYSLQGEGPWLGLPAVFIRLSGCIEPYCPWCDTAYALYESTNMSNESIIETIKEYQCKNVVITGGEPFLQWNFGLAELHRSLTDKGYAIQYETSGKVPFPKLEDAVIICSPKYIDGLWIFDFSNLGNADFYKFLAHDRASFGKIKDFITEYSLPAERIFIMPMGETRTDQMMNMEKVFAFCTEHGYRMTPRLHILTFDTRRGV